MKNGTASTPPGRDGEGDQFRLVRIQTYNWGTFDGLVDVAVAAAGYLFVGPSGSGKSTLLDAHAALLTPPRWVDFNVAAREAERHGKDRNLMTYVRGAWSQQTSDQQAQEQRMQQMQERMKKMQQEMDQIQQSKDPKERQRLMQQHMQTMQEQMRDMRMMGGPMMMGMMGPGMHGRGMKGDPQARQKMTEDRLDMMQMMMEQMMEQMQMQGGAPKK